MTQPSLRRLKRDELDTGMYEKHFKVGPKESMVPMPDGTIAVEKNYYEWDGVIYGPEGSPYEGGTFKLGIFIPSDYPLRPPLIKFLTRIYHPNIKTDGQICLDILKLPAWSPALGINRALLSIMLLLSSPNAEDPLNAEAGRILRERPDEFKSIAITWTAEYAMGF
jgi:ubiquitin-protein ligase